MNRDNKKYEGKTKDIQRNYMTKYEIKRKIEELNSLSELKPEDYALEDGIAASIAQNMGEMKFTQLRKFFGHIKKIETTKIRGKLESESINKSDIYFLMPELAYGVGREVITKDFYEIMKICITKKIGTVKDFKRFVELLSAVIAYYKMRKA
jgi:CRISPR type III-A-associated protein Csm2